MNLLQGKIALITGGSRGIGESLVRKFVEQGASVAFTYVSASSQARAEKLAQELGSAAPKPTKAMPAISLKPKPSSRRCWPTLANSTS